MQFIRPGFYPICRDWKISRGSPYLLNSSKLVKALKEEGVDVLFGYPGACTIDISDELYKQSGIDIILPRHDVHEADAYARTTGKVDLSSNIWIVCLLPVTTVIRRRIGIIY